MPSPKLNDPATKIAFIGEKYAKKLKQLEIKTVEDLIRHYPSRYEKYKQVNKISEIENRPINKAGVVGKLTEIKDIRTKHGKFLTTGVIEDETAQLDVVWFNNRYITKSLKKGDTISLSGKLGEFNNKKTLIAPQYEKLRPDQSGTKLIHTRKLTPIYPETAGVSSKWLRSRLNAVINKYKVPEQLKDYLPEKIIKNHQLISLQKALKQIHFPKTETEIAEAKKRLGFDELFMLQLKNLQRRKKWKEKTPPVNLKIGNYKSEISNFIVQLPFQLTAAQEKCIQQILADLEKNKPMNRLLQGDVGSGKTVVAAVAMYATHLNNVQAVLMAPTEILAEQHYKELKNLTKNNPIPLALLTGSKKPGSKNLKPNSIIIGTHALLYNPDLLDKVGLVVIDEQQRFGVKQRSKLIKENKKTPHTLTMTATPIPRSLALTLYGNLDISTLDEMPPGRTPVKTWVVPPKKHKAGYKWAKLQNSKFKTQIFVICPLIEESEHETLQDVKAVKSHFKQLKKAVFADLKLGLLHGQLKAEEKETILNKFRKGKIDVLVSTPVVEVGVDIPNANIIIIEAAERFGLASLHQLRGRVGRGDQQAYCLLIAKNKGATFKRLKAMEEINSGFELAELDLKIRGPGEIYGTKQHGNIELKLASLSNQTLIQQTRIAAEKIIKQGIEKYPDLRDKIEAEVEQAVEPN